MDAEPGVAEQVVDVMRQNIDSTRSDLADKLEALEDRVMGTVQNAQDTVDGSIQMARETVASVKQTFDIRHHVDQHPWLMLGGSVVAGLALGSLLATMLRRSRQTPARPAGNEAPSFMRPQQRGNGDGAAAPAPMVQAPPPDGPGVFDLFHEEINKVKGMAIGFVMGRVRDSIKDSLPPDLATRIEDVMNSVTTKLGATTVPEHSR